MEKNIKNGEEEISRLQTIMAEVKSPETGNVYGNTEEQAKIMQDFALRISENYLHDCLADILR